MYLALQIITTVCIVLTLASMITYLIRIRAVEKELAVQHEWIIEATKHILEFGSKN